MQEDGVLLRLCLAVLALLDEDKAAFGCCNKVLRVGVGSVELLQAVSTADHVEHGDVVGGEACMVYGGDRWVGCTSW